MFDDHAHDHDHDHAHDHDHDHDHADHADDDHLHPGPMHHDFHNSSALDFVPIEVIQHL